jgi:hypothetical protein
MIIAIRDSYLREGQFPLNRELAAWATDTTLLSLYFLFLLALKSDPNDGFSRVPVILIGISVAP